MRLINIINHSLSELKELGIITTMEYNALKKEQFRCTNDIINYHLDHKNFDSIPGLTTTNREFLARLSNTFQEAERKGIVKDNLFDDEVHNEDRLIVPYKIDWSRYGEIHIKVLSKWIIQKIAIYEQEELREFFDDYLGEIKDAEDFYSRAILKPLREDRDSISDSILLPYMSYQVRIFLKFCQALYVLKNTYDLVKFYAWCEFAMKRNHEDHDAINKLFVNDKFPYAFAVYSIVMASPYFTYPRRMKQINRMRYVSIFNDYPYRWGEIGPENYMPEEWFDENQRAANTYAENACRSVISFLKSLGYKSNYRESENWIDVFLSDFLVKEINEKEELYLPNRFYMFLFNELYDSKFDRTITFG